MSACRPATSVQHCLKSLSGVYRTTFAHPIAQHSSDSHTPWPYIPALLTAPITKAFAFHSTGHTARSASLYVTPFCRHAGLPFADRDFGRKQSPLKTTAGHSLNRRVAGCFAISLMMMTPSQLPTASKPSGGGWRSSLDGPFERARAGFGDLQRASLRNRAEVLVAALYGLLVVVQRGPTVALVWLWSFVACRSSFSFLRHRRFLLRVVRGRLSRAGELERGRALGSAGLPLRSQARGTRRADDTSRSLCDAVISCACGRRSGNGTRTERWPLISGTPGNIKERHTQPPWRGALFLYSRTTFSGYERKAIRRQSAHK